MGVPIRIKFCENVDHFVEARQQLPPTEPLFSERTINIFLNVLIIVPFFYELWRQHERGLNVKYLFVATLFFVLVMNFWFWLFKKSGLYKNWPPAEYECTEKDGGRLQKAYFKQTGRNETMVVCEFTSRDFTLSSENDKPGIHEWSAIKKVVERPKGVLVFIRKSVYFWFPRRAFDSLESYRELLDLVEQKVSRFQRLKLAIIALGSNLGDSSKIILQAMNRLEDFSGERILKSSFWQTTPVDCPPESPKFVNAVVGLVPRNQETPESLLGKLQQVEKKSGRIPKKVLNEPRPLDLDLIAFGDEIRNSPELILPHPRAHLRRFVLQPLSEISPDLVLPGQTKSVSQLLAELPATESIERLA